MRFVVFGAGAIGGVVGARLAGSGADVALVARGAHHDAIAARGLRVDGPDGSVTVRLPVTDDVGTLTIGSDDVVLLAVKTQDTAAALEALTRHADPSVAIVCLQNGVENERAALRRFARVYAVPVVCPAAHLEPGVVEAFAGARAGVLDVGRYPDGVDELARAVAAAFADAGIDARPRPDAMRWKYRKLLFNLGNAIEAVCGPDARAGEIGDLAAAEGEACLDAAGIDRASPEEWQERYDGLLPPESQARGARPGGSSWQSLQRRSGAIETDYLNGEIVLLGRRHGVPTPVNALLQRWAALLAARRRPPGTVTPPEFLARLDRGDLPTKRSERHHDP